MFLLFRPYVRPIDLFLHMEHHYGISQFMESRVNAECVARQKHSEQIDVTLDQIYEEIDENNNTATMCDQIMSYKEKPFN